MKAISVLEFRKQAASILKQVQQGQRFIVTYRGKEVARLEPVTRDIDPSDDPFYALDRLASETGKSLSNAEMDRIIYGT